MRTIGVCLTILSAAGWAQGADEYLREHIYDTSVGPDEALVNVSLVNNRWPDCTTLESAVRDMFRLEGAADKSDHAKAQALWKWFRILVSSTGGAYDYELDGRGRLGIVKDPHKIFAVYGHHQCDGLSWAMAPLWRAAGYMAFDSATHGHTTAALRYRDDDGVMRYHGFDPQGRFFWWDREHKRVGTRTVPVMTGNIYRHVLQPRRLHSLHTDLRPGETIERLWDNRGYVLPSGKWPKVVFPRYYTYRPGRTDGIYAVVGEQVQTLQADTHPKRFAGQLYTGSENTACSGPGSAALAALHPAKAGETASFVYRLAPPYVAIDATVEATLVSGGKGDLCRLSLSPDGGKRWRTIFDKTDAGTDKVSVDIGREARKAKRPNVYSRYDLLIKAEFKTERRVRSVGMNVLRVKVHRMFNKRALANLMSGENVYRVNADRMADGMALKLQFKCQLSGKDVTRDFTIGSFPFYFKIDAPEMKLRRIRDFDKKFNIWEARMVSYRMSLVPAAGAKLDEGLDPKVAAVKFTKSYPHPSSMIRQREPKKRETDPMQTNGHFPQGTERLAKDEQMEALCKLLPTGSDSSYKKWHAAQGLAKYPDAVDALCKKLPSANIDLTLFI
ncbi:hypothetical protein LCGC14_1649400, partial [marine sediment metagenome]